MGGRDRRDSEDFAQGKLLTYIARDKERGHPLREGSLSKQERAGDRYRRRAD